MRIFQDLGVEVVVVVLVGRERLHKRVRVVEREREVEGVRANIRQSERSLSGCSLVREFLRQQGTQIASDVAS